MKKRKWLSKDKFKIILEGLSGNIEISKLCSKYQIAQTQYYQWRDQLLKYGNQAFEQKNVTKKEQNLESEVTKLNRIIGALTVERKKSEDELRKEPNPNPSLNAMKFFWLESKTSRLNTPSGASAGSGHILSSVKA